MYKVVAVKGEKRVSCIVAFTLHAELTEKFTREYSTKVAVKNGYVFSTLKNAINFVRTVYYWCPATLPVEIWRVKVRTSRKVIKMNKTMKPNWFIDIPFPIMSVVELRRYEGPWVEAPPIGTRFAYNIKLDRLAHRFNNLNDYNK